MLTRVLRKSPWPTPSVLVIGCLAAVVVVDTLPAHADGLFYQLPQDGAGVVFDLVLSVDAQGEERTATGSLSMSSVGDKQVAGEVCRFIEFKLVMKTNDQEQVILAKALMPENELKRGGHPWENFKQAWVKMGDSDIREITERYGNDAGPMPAFMSGPLKNHAELPAVEVESGLGRLSCEGVAGEVLLDDGNFKTTITFKNRLHERAPFGVVTAKMTFRVERDGARREGGTMFLKLAEAKKDVTTELPDVP